MRAKRNFFYNIKAATAAAAMPAREPVRILAELLFEEADPPVLEPEPVAELLDLLAELEDPAEPEPDLVVEPELEPDSLAAPV